VDLLKPHDINLLVDPFTPGEELFARIDTLEIETLLFLADEGSLNSRVCSYEWQSAASRGLPVVVLTRGNVEIPEALKTRLYLSVESLQEDVEAEVGHVASGIHARTAVLRTLRSLSTLTFHEQVARSKFLWADTDTVVLAEFVDRICDCYNRLSDPTTRGWLARALGRAATVSAARALLALYIRNEDHPLAIDAVRESLEKIEVELPGHSVASEIRQTLRPSM
jgi:hypothetical protein